MNQEEEDQGGRKGLSARKGRRQEGRDGEVIPRRQGLVPTPTVVNS